MGIFIKKVFWFSIGLLILFVLISSVLVYTDNSVTRQLYKYQLTKIENNKNNYTNLFIGDSSLGNAIDSDEFSTLSSQPTINCALNGLFGYAGSYNILKTMHKNHPELENVVIMQTLDMQTRNVSMPGYVRSINSMGDFTELELEYKFKFIEEYTAYLRSTLSFNKGKKDIISNDYIIQSETLYDTSRLKPLSVNDINSNKIKFLEKIIDYCRIHNLNLIYIHGPMHEEKIQMSKAYIDFVNLAISNSGITLIKDVVAIKKDHIGDNEDHVMPKYKKQYTSKFYQALKNNLNAEHSNSHQSE